MHLQTKTAQCPTGATGAPAPSLAARARAPRRAPSWKRHSAPACATTICQSARPVRLCSAVRRRRGRRVHMHVPPRERRSLTRGPRCCCASYRRRLQCVGVVGLVCLRRHVWPNRKPAAVADRGSGASRGRRRVPGTRRVRAVLRPTMWYVRRPRCLLSQWCSTWFVPCAHPSPRPPRAPCSRRLSHVPVVGVAAVLRHLRGRRALAAAQCRDPGSPRGRRVPVQPVAD